jgi:CheY-like chemotaxis protein
MNKVQIMIVGNTKQHIATIKDQLVPHDDWYITGFTQAEEAISAFQLSGFDVVLFSNDMDQIEARKLSRIFRFQDNDIILISPKADDDPLTLIQEGLLKRKQAHKPVYAFKDDALRDAIFNIHLS